MKKNNSETPLKVLLVVTVISILSSFEPTQDLIAQLLN